jgi:hypothetical protein
MKLAILLLALAVALQSADNNSAAIHKWSAEDPVCKRLLVNGQTILDIDAAGFHVGVVLQDTGWKTRADIKITNHSAQPVDIHPDQFKATETEGPKTRELKYNDPDALIKAIRKRAYWNQFGAAMGGGMATRTTTSQTTESGTATATGPGGTATGTYGGGSTTTTTEPDYDARRRADAQVAQIGANANNAAANLQSVALRANTVLPSREIYGAVFFDRKAKHATDCVLTVLVGAEVYEFPFHWAK